MQKPVNTAKSVLIGCLLPEMKNKLSGFHDSYWVNWSQGSRKMKCPKCTGSLYSFNVEQKMRCPKCDAVLHSANYSRVASIGVAIWLGLLLHLGHKYQDGEIVLWEFSAYTVLSFFVSLLPSVFLTYKVIEEN